MKRVKRFIRTVKEYQHKKMLYSLELADDGLKDYNIPKGSTMVIRGARKVESGDLAFVRVDGIPMLRYAIESKGGLMLVAGNSKYAPIFVDDASDFFVYGKVVEIKLAIPQVSYGTQSV